MSQPDIRVGMLSHAYLPVLGGAERQMAGLIPLMAERGVAARVITRSHPGSPAHEVLDGVDVTRVPADGIPRTGSMRYSIGALRDLRRRPVDLLHAHSLLSPATTALAAKRMLDVPAIAKILRGGALGDLMDLRRKGIGDLRFRLLRAGLDGFVVISHEIEAELAAVGTPERDYWFIPNGVDIRRFEPVGRDRRLQYRTQLALIGDPLLVFAGRLAPEKEVDLLLSAWSTIAARHPDAGLVIIGDGPEGPALRARGGPGVHFAGMVEDVAPYLAAADGFVLPSRAEGLSNALLEAMAAGLAPIATAVGGANDLIGPDRGWLIGPGDRSSLELGLDAALSDIDGLVERGCRSRAVVEDSYSLEAVADALVALYTSLVDRRSDGRITG